MKKNRKILKLLVLGAFIFFLAACGNINEPISSNSTGLWDRYVIYNLSQVIIWLSNLFGGSYVMGIVVFTLIIRLLMTPLYRMQVKSQREMQELQPEIDAIKTKYPNKDRQSMEMMQEEQQQLMEERGVNQFAGCLPLLIQLPVMMALYQAILRSDALKQGDFLWMNLGQPDPYFVLPIIAAGLTLATTYFTMKSNPQNNAMTKGMMFLSPLMILFISVGLPSAIAIYWVVSNGITLIMTLIFNNPYQIIAEREEKIQAEKELQRKLRKEYRRKTGKRHR